LNFIEAIETFREAGEEVIDRNAEYTAAFCEAMLAADGKTAEVRKAQAEKASASALASLQRAELKKQIHFQVVLHYRGHVAPAKPSPLEHRAERMSAGRTADLLAE